MRTTRDTTQFKKDYKRVSKGQYQSTFDEDFIVVLASLLRDQPLPARCRDHALTGEYTGHRECHIKPDLLLIYMKPDADILVLVRLGSRRQLFK